ncbi:MAG TPA: hypothetical protein VE666_05785 [Mycobacterium sp.]|nr:hypothetical protein [Mycobacterium sp.]
MHNRVKLASASAVFGGALLAAGGFGLANAAPPAQSVVNDGQVNVTVMAKGQQVGVLQDVSLKNAEALAASACASADIGPDAFQALDVSNTPISGTCASADGLSLTFAQNSPGQSENAPAQSPVTPSSSTVAPTTAR